MRIDEHINSINIATEFLAVDELLTTAQGTISFWGDRLITVAGYEGSFLLDELAEKVLKAAVQRCHSDNLTIQERVAGIEIRNKLKNLYQITDTELSRASYFTNLLNGVKEFKFFPYPPRFHVEVGLMKSYFRGYSEDRFFQEFGGNKEEKTSSFYENSDGSFVLPLRIMAREDVIRAKLST